MRKALSLLIKAAVSGLLLYLALRTVDVAAVAGRLSQIDPGWIGLGLILLFVQLFVLSVRWRQIIHRCGAELALPETYRFNLIGAFFSQTLPSSVGGDAMRIWLLGKKANWRAAGYSVFIDRVIGVFALAVLVVVCLPWTLRLISNPVGRGALLLIGFGVVAGGIVFVGLASPRLHILQRWSATRHLAAMASVAASMLRSPRLAASIFTLSIAIHLMSALAGWCAARAVHADFPLLYSVFLVPPVILVTVVPISVAGWGVREGAMVAAFSYAGLAQSDGLIISLLFGAGFLTVGMIGGLVWILTVNRTERKAGPVPALDS
jgi:uncharacterized membrane protein YbhN (UPF0104 family)